MDYTPEQRAAIQAKQANDSIAAFQAQFTPGDKFGTGFVVVDGKPALGDIRKKPQIKEDKLRRYTRKVWRTMPNGTVEQRIFRNEEVH